MNNTSLYIFLCILAVLSGCQRVSNGGDIVASVGDIVLTSEELNQVIPRNLSDEDSAQFADKFVHNWLREQVIFAYANNLPEEEMDFDEELENYKRSLVNFAFENHMVQQYLDTVVSDTEISEYYEANLQNFQLKDYIVRVKFCILDSSVVTDDEFVRIFNSNEDEDLVLFEQFCVNNGASYFIEDEKWLYFNDLLNEVPLEVYNVEQFLKKDKSLSFYAASKHYFLNIVDFKLKDSVSPLSLQKEKIRNIILNRRKLDLLSKMRDDLYNEAVQKNSIHIYTE